MLSVDVLLQVCVHTWAGVVLHSVLLVKESISLRPAPIWFQLGPQVSFCPERPPAPTPPRPRGGPT